MHVALLRAINVAGRNLIAMASLRELFTDLGFAGAKTLLQSGNVVFDGGRKASSRLEEFLERETAERLGVAADYCVRTAGEWQSIIERNPFPAEAESGPNHLVVMLLKSEPGTAAVKSLREAISGPEIIHCDGRQLYSFYPAGIGTSKLTNRVIETRLATRGTGRNWNTVLKLAGMLEADS